MFYSPPLHDTAHAMPTVYLLDYVAGNVRSLANAIEKVGYTIQWVRSPADVPAADVCRPRPWPRPWPCPSQLCNTPIDMR